MTSEITHDQDVVLVVDDSPEALSMLNQALEQAGLAVLIALEGHQAINIAQKMVPDLIVLDALMPNLNGFETCKQIKADPRTAHIPVIFMTALSDTESIVKGLEVGGVDYLTKPFTPDELVARLRVHLANARLTNSAHTALDTTGQNLFTVDSKSKIRWATPQTKKLFSEANANESWQQTALAEQLQQWLNHHPSPGQTLSLSQIEHPLKVRLIEHSGPQEVLLKLLDATAPSGAKKLHALLPITERESDVLYWIGNGKTNREIGQILETSPRTVNKHLEQIYRKLEVDNRTSAAAIAIRLLIDEP